MSFVITAPETMTVTATDLANIGSAIGSANAVAAAPTTGVMAAGADEVSAAISGLFNAYAREFQALSARAATFHEQLVSLLNGGAAAYLGTEIANAEQALIGAVNAPVQSLLGHPLIPAGGPSAVGQGVGAVAALQSGVATSAGQAVAAAALLPGRVAAGMQSVSASLLGTPTALAAATPGIAGPYQDLIATTSANLQSLGSTWATNPAPFLRQVIANQMAYGQTIATSLQNAAQHLGTALSDPSALNHVAADLFPIAAIPAQIQQNLVNVGTTLTKVAPAVTLAALGPPLSTLGGFGTAVAAFTGAVQTGDVAGALGALIDAPAFVANGFLNGEVTLPLLLPLGLGLLVLDIPFDGILAPPHAMTGTLVWFLPPFVDDITGPPVSGILPTLMNVVPQQLALAITPA
ncbi:PE family protein [Mycobacterium ostraviense]|uniref:PE-PGRS family protein n=1 Tax=Mycobacterium ostraviense TaxID=2738409 RepID=A0A164B9P2_9MYCO|nr:PE family protein [Mycobacterium ostraviense]KZS63257.1 PE-PGRS family protein [Mycobacterium ostraviense]UGT91974.1 PE domain-containing protein [Mycobacterium ostraviense]